MYINTQWTIYNNSNLHNMPVTFKAIIYTAAVYVNDARVAETQPSIELIYLDSIGLISLDEALSIFFTESGRVLSDRNLLRSDLLLILY